MTADLSGGHGCCCNGLSHSMLCKLKQVWICISRAVHLKEQLHVVMIGCQEARDTHCFGNQCKSDDNLLRLGQERLDAWPLKWTDAWGIILPLKVKRRCEKQARALSTACPLILKFPG